MNNHHQLIPLKKEIQEEQVYLLEPDDGYDLNLAWYDRKHCIDRFVFDDGKYIDYPVGDLIFDIKDISVKVDKYDFINNDFSCPLISPRLQEFLLKYAANQIQLFDTIICCKDKQIANYKLVNITNTARCIDHEKSVYLREDKQGNDCKEGGRIWDFRSLKHTPGSMGNLLIAREEEYKSNVLVSGKLVKASVENFPNPVGFNYYVPEVWYAN